MVIFRSLGRLKAESLEVRKAITEKKQLLEEWSKKVEEAKGWAEEASEVSRRDTLRAAKSCSKSL